MARPNAWPRYIPWRGQKASRRNGFLLPARHRALKVQRFLRIKSCLANSKGLAAIQPIRYREFSSPGRPVSFCCDLWVQVEHCCKYVQLVPAHGNIRAWNFSVRLKRFGRQ